MQQNNLATEIILGVVAGLIAIAAPVLLYLGKVDFTGAMGIWALAAGLVVGKLALNAPSPSQQAQIGAQQSQVLSQQQQLQQLVSYALGMLPGLVQSLSQQTPPVASPQPAQVSVPLQSSVVPGVTNVPTVPNSSAVSSPTGTGTVSTPTPSPFHSGAMSGLVATPPPLPTPPQFKTIQIPDVSMPMSAVGQGIPLGQ